MRWTAFSTLINSPLRPAHPDHIRRTDRAQKTGDAVRASPARFDFDLRRLEQGDQALLVGDG